MRELLAIRDARIYLAGQACSLFGDSALLLVLAIWVKELTGSSGRAGLVFFAFGAATLLAPLTGVLVDRVRRRTLLIAANLLSAVAVLPLLLVGDDPGRAWMIYAVAWLYGLSYVVIGAGQSALLATMLRDELLVQANGLLQTVREGLRLVAPLLGAGIFAAFGAATLVALDATTFLVAAAALALLRLRELPPDPEERTERPLAEIAAGARHIAAVVELRRVVLAVAASLLAIGLCESLMFEVVARGFGQGPSFLGVLLAVQGVGAIAGGLTAARVSRGIGETGLAAAGMACFALGCALQATGMVPVMLAGTVLFGFALPWIVVGEVTLLQRRTPDRLQGRAFSAAELLTGLPQTLSIGAGALLVGLADYRLLLLLVAVVVGAAGAWLAGGKGLGGRRRTSAWVPES